MTRCKNTVTSIILHQSHVRRVCAGLGKTETLNRMFNASVTVSFPEIRACHAFQFTVTLLRRCGVSCFIKKNKCAIICPRLSACVCGSCQESAVEKQACSRLLRKHALWCEQGKTLNKYETLSGCTMKENS